MENREVGARFSEGAGVQWRIWAPEHQALEVVLHDAKGAPGEVLPMKREADGFFTAALPEGKPGTRYKIRIDGEGPWPDPWSRSQPLGVHGPSEVVTADFPWTDAGWRGRPADDLVIYELHVGTATEAGTFEALIPRLKDLRALGVNALELMPLASFPGARNWGYDGVQWFAPPQVYGGPASLRRLIDAAHREGLAVLVDAVYNHFGPDGNYLSLYASHYFTGRHHTPWGEAVNYDGPDSAVVREMVLSNAEMWIRDFHADGLRLDAAHSILDDSKRHLLAELSERVKAAAEGRSVVLLAEDERNDVRLVTPVSRGGYGLDGVWADDFHHQMRRAFAGDSEGYYQDYTGSVEDLAATLRRGWFYEGQHSKNLKKNRGTPAGALEPHHFIHCIQNHDQVGNRPLGGRLGQDVSPAAYRAMSALLLLSPYTPLLFMGQEWNATTPFLYFTDHPPELGKQVTEGRRKEFAGFAGFTGQEVPDPQAAETFQRSVLDWAEAEEPRHAPIRALYRQLLRLRSELPALRDRGRGSYDAQALDTDALLLTRRHGAETLDLLVNVRGSVTHRFPQEATALLWTEAPRFGGEVKDAPLVEGEARLEGPSALLVRR